MQDDKYIVFRRDELEAWFALPQADPTLPPSPIEDAVVIRRQDVFAPPALDAYANAIYAAVEVLNNANDGTDGTANLAAVADLSSIADYFHAQAVEAWQTDRKIPD